MPESRAHHRTEIDPDDVSWLTSPAAERWLQALPNTPATAADIALLRRELSPARTHLVVEQVTLRQRARVKFSAADRMFFTARGLEQATDEVLAAYKAERFAGRERVFDLCSGIGGDFVALARRQQTIAIDCDPVMTIIAQANARAVLGTDPLQSMAREDDASRTAVRACGAWHIDPDRRAEGRRTTRIERYEPGAESIERLLRENDNAAIKLAPAAVVPEEWLAQAELEWIGRHRECRQLVAWFGELALHPGERRATVLGETTTPQCSVVGRPGDEPPAANRVSRYVFEPDAAVLAAGLGPSLANKYGLERVTAGVGYWTGDASVEDGALACFEVEEMLPHDTRRLRALLHTRKVGRLEIKKRGVDIRPDALRRDLRLAGDAGATLIVTRVDGRVTAILARRIEKQA
jgi:hypothetical protein